MTDPRRKITGIYGILPEGLETDGLLQKAQAALAGGIKTLQLRDKNRSYGESLERSRQLCQLAHSYGARLIVNDSLRLACECGADGVHLGRSDMQDIARLRSEIGGRLLIGISCQGDTIFAHRVLRQGADYVSFGAIFASKSKKEAVPIGPARLATARQLLPRANICAIGGIGLESLPDIRKAGADCAAVISSLFGVGDVWQRARMMVETWNSAPSA
jgi:thiamine-phosphate pyrophosphorylase